MVGPHGAFRPCLSSFIHNLPASRIKLDLRHAWVTVLCVCAVSEESVMDDNGTDYIPVPRNDVLITSITFNALMPSLDVGVSGAGSLGVSSSA